MSLLASPREQCSVVDSRNRFRWAVCQIDVLRRLKYERGNIEKALRNLPETLDETYERILLAISEEERLSVHHIFQWISYHNDLYDGAGMPCEVLIQALGKSAAELSASGLERFYDNDALREICGCLIKVGPEIKYLGNVQHTNLTVSFAHYTVRECLDSSRSKCSKALFTTSPESLRENALMVVFSEAQHVESNELCDCRDAPYDPSNFFHDKDRRLADYCVVSAILSSRKWSEKISQHGKLYNLAIDLLDPSKPHFDSLIHTASEIEESSNLFSDWGFNFDEHIWEVVWYSETSNTIAFHLFNILSLVGGL